MSNKYAHSTINYLLVSLCVSTELAWSQNRVWSDVVMINVRKTILLSIVDTAYTCVTDDIKASIIGGERDQWADNKNHMGTLGCCREGG
jgi:hypothetical protein